MFINHAEKRTFKKRISFGENTCTTDPRFHSEINQAPQTMILANNFELSLYV